MKNEVSEIKLKGYILYVPTEMLARTAQNPEGTAKEAIDGLRSMIDQLMNGQINSVVIPSDTFDNGVRKFDVKFID